MNNRAKILLLILLFCQPADAKADWPNWGGPNRDFRVNDAGVFPPDQNYALKIVWKKPLGAGYSSISIRGDLAVTMYSDETFDYVIGLNTEDGSERWKYKIGAAYLGHYGSQSGPLSTPIVTENKVIALGPRGNLFALDANTGKELWKIDLVAAHRA
ncbi:MAG: PQQ-binding-like beta-propeller repeat protein, partial [Gemmatimonadota bacterium]|nr:PQQ-binding-like beta-propeller repeat protein [Gemmatimonadota bacterium]